MNKGGLYFHIPFCRKKCAYCDFCSFTDVSTEGMEKYADALICEMRAQSEKAKNAIFDTVFFGGGTPTLLPVSCVAKILNAAKTMFNIEQDSEITMEANPATANEETLSSLRALGVNRLSVGVQSLVDSELSILGRLHNAKDALSFLQTARHLGFDNINVDLMYGIPAQTERSVSDTLQAVMEFSPAHISAYSLMLEEGTPLYKKRDTLSFPDEDTEDAIDRLVRTTLGKHGYLHYEISNYAKSGKESRHNLHYWHSDPYLGFGVAAHSFWGGVRYGNHTDFSRYLSDPVRAEASREVLTEGDLAYEWIMLRLRLSEGIDLEEYQRRFGVDLIQAHEKAISDFASLGLLKTEGGRLFLTERGFRVSNSILASLLLDEKNS